MFQKGHGYFRPGRGSACRHRNSSKAQTIHDGQEKFLNIREMQRSSIKGLKAYDPELLANYRYKVDANENGYDVPPLARKKILKEMGKIFFNRYPDPGAVKLKGILAKMNSVSPGSIVIGNGSDELIHYLLQAFTDPGDIIAAPAPSFDM